MATVYDKSSLFLAPSGVSNGTVFTQKPVPIYGAELVTNGDFATDSDWTKGTSWSIGGGVATYDKISSGQELTQLMSNIAAGKTIEVKFDISNIEATKSAYFKLDCSGSPEPIFAYTLFSEGTYTYRHKITGGFNRLTFTAVNSSSQAGAFSIDNISVKEVSNYGDFAFSRGSNLSATRVNADGLIEKGRENLLLQSNQFDTTWTTYGTSVTSGESGYNGTNDAWLLSKSGANGHLNQSNIDNGVQTFSIYAKANESNFLYVRIYADSPRVYFDLINGVATNSGPVISSSMEDVGNGWYRCSFSSTTTSASFLRIYPAEAAFDSSATSGSVYIQDAQLEIGLAATKPIETTTTTVKAGLLENTPRLDYSGGSTCPSLLLEPSRTNLVQSEYITLILNGAIEYNNTTSPEGLQNAILFTSNNSASSYFRSNVFTATDPTNISVFVKYTNNQYIQLLMSGDAGHFVNFDIQNGSIGTSGAKTSNETIEDYGNGWYRVSATFTGYTGNPTARIYLSNSSSAGFGGAGSAIGKSVNAYGLQVESNASYASSYIPNHSSGSITRGADAALSSTLNLSKADFTLFVEFEFYGVKVGDEQRFYISRGVDNDSAILGIKNGKQVQMTRQSGGVTLFNDTLGAQFSAGNNYKYLGKWSSGDNKSFLNGVQKTSNTMTYSDFTTDITHLNLTGSQPTNAMLDYGLKVKQVLYFPEALSDIDCEILTGATTYETFEEMALALNYTVYE